MAKAVRAISSTRHALRVSSCKQREELTSRRGVLVMKHISTSSQEKTRAAAAGIPAQMSNPAATATYTEPTVKSFNEIPGPRQWPLLGSFPAIYKNIKKMHEALFSLRQQYGDIYQLRLPGKAPMVVTTNLYAVEHLFRTEGLCPTRTTGSPIDWYFQNSNVLPGALFA